MVGECVLTLYHAKARIPITATEPTTAPATIPPTGTDEEDAGTTVDEAEMDEEDAGTTVGVEVDEVLVTLVYFINENFLKSEQPRTMSLEL